MELLWQPEPLSLALMDKNATIAFLGLGVMGAPMAGHLARAGHQLTVYNRTAGKAHGLRAVLADEQVMIETAATPADAAQGADIVISCVGNDDDAAQVLLGSDGAMQTMRNKALLIDHTTLSAQMARSIDTAARERGIAALDAPVSGGQVGAENGALAIMCGGSDEAFAQAEPVMQAYGSRIIHVGPSGAGQTAKMANQMCIAGLLGGLSEAIRLTTASGLDTQAVFAAISGGAAQSWQMENRWASMVDDQFDFGFAIDWMRKDLGYALAEANRMGLSSPVTALVDQLYAEVQAAGGNRLDTSALITRYPTGKPQ